MRSPPALLVLVALLVALSIGAPSAAQAQELGWDDTYRDVGWPEAATIGGSTALLGLLYFGVGEPEAPRWVGPILVDDAFRNLMFDESVESAATTAIVSDVIVSTLMGYTILVDAVGVAGMGHDEWKTAFQTSTIAAQSLALSTLTVNALKFSIARRRPGFGRCYDEPDHDPSCADRPNVSFPSGHATAAFTGAGLVCATHEALPLYGGGWGDRVACFASLALAATTGVLRVTSNNHYLSDITVGGLIGFGFGYLLPRLVYFDDSDDDASAASATALMTTVPAAPTMLQWRGDW